MSLKNALKIDDQNTLKLILLVILVIWCCLGLMLFSVHHYFRGAGTLGDTFGIINSLFGALAFGGLFYTILLQKKELREAREIFVKQKESVDRQRFESTFFNLLNVHNHLTDTINNRGLVGRPAFANILKQNQFGFGSYSTQPYRAEYFAKFKFDYEDQFMKDNYQYFSHYIESLNTVFVYVFRSKLVEVDEKMQYYDILKATISISEQSFLIYHLCLAPKTEVVNNLNYFNRISGFLSLTPATVLLHSSHKDEFVKQIQ